MTTTSKTKEQVLDVPKDSMLHESPMDLDRAIDQAAMNGESLNFEVTDKLFNYLVRDHKTGYATYKNAKIFRAGTKKELLRQDRMNAEEYGDMKNRQIAEESRKRLEAMADED